ncbi:MAG: D-Ala-D-Ala carboxypeptidase family metallohydrolase [Actinomycetota bacterium]
MLIVSIPARASAYEFTRPLREGDTGPDVRALQVRVAGWFGRSNRKTFLIDGDFGPRTAGAVKAFQRHFGLDVDGVAGAGTFEILTRLEDGNGSTAHFDYSEFWQNKNPACSAKANAYAGTFQGGMVAPGKVKRNVRRLMWRLEAVRAKGGRHPIGINSGFRSVAYNDCIGGARASQHLYGSAADNRMAEVANRAERDLARRSQLSGIGCYGSLSHNHFDIRMDNKDLPATQALWWPERDNKGRDLDDNGVPCWGEVKSAAVAKASVAGAGSFVPSAHEVAAFEAAGELFFDLGGAE